LSGPLRIVLLGASGSIGTQAREVISRYPEDFELFGAVTQSSPIEPAPARLVRAHERGAEERIEELVTHPSCDLVLVAIPGAAALRPTLAALQAGKRVALATKEVLVMAGALVLGTARSQDSIRPVDSEHSAIWQCLWGEAAESLERIVLTASGGPFWGRPDLDLSSVTQDQALNHPRWEMGPKVSIDSATLMNKGLELIEAHHLFGVSLDQIEVVVHPQSVVHSLVRFRDGSYKAQLSQPDMRLPIALALSYPRRLPGVATPVAVPDLSPLEFHALDSDRFPAVELARRAARAGGGQPAALNAANEEAVAAFLAGRLPFSGIVPAVAAALDQDLPRGQTLEDVLEADRLARAWVRHSLGTL